MNSYSKRFRDPNQGPLKLEHNASPRDPHDDYTPTVRDPISHVKVHNHHKVAYDPPPSRPHESLPGGPFGRKAQFLSSGVISEGKGGMLVYGSDPGGRPLEFSAAVTLQEKSSADLVKRRKQQEDAEYDIARWRQQKAGEVHYRQEEKRKDLEMLKGYVPWGKPGAGAPMKAYDGSLQAKMGKLLEEPMEVPSSEGFFSSFGRPGAGAPNRTSSGRVKTTLTQDPSTRFQPTMKRDVEFHFRYARGDRDVSDYAHSLESQVKQHTEQQARQREWEREKDTEMMQYDPYGRPGAGAPNRNEKGHVVAGMKNSLASESTTSIEEKMRYGQKLEKQIQEKAVARQKSLGQIGSYDPWGKGAGAPQRDRSGNIRRHQHSDRTHIREFSPVHESNNGISLGRPGAGAPIVDDSGKPRARLQHTLKDDVARDVSGHEHHNHSEFYKFGRPGGGAPVKDQTGKVAAKRGHYTREQEQMRNSQEQKDYLDLLRNDMEAKRDRDRQQREEKLKQSAEFAHLVERGKVGQPKRDPTTGQLLTKQPRTGSDVTSLRLDIRRPDPVKSVEYNNALNEQLEINRQQQDGSGRLGRHGVDDTRLPWQRSVESDRLKRETYGHELDMMLKQKEDEKLRESTERLMEEQKHVDSYNSLWGRPGAGAPRRDAKGKVVAQRNYKTLEEDSYRSEAVRL